MVLTMNRFLIMLCPIIAEIYELPQRHIYHVSLVLVVVPFIALCVVLNRYIFKSADMIGGAING